MNTREKLLLMWAVAATGLLLALAAVIGWMVFPRPLLGVSLLGAAQMPTGAVMLYQCNRVAASCAPISSAESIFLQPDSMFSEFARNVRLGTDEKNALVWVAHDSPMEWRAFSPISTHLGCFVRWQETRELFVDPCGGAGWERDGAYREGPAPRALDYFPIHVENGEVLIDFELVKGKPNPQ